MAEAMQPTLPPAGLCSEKDHKTHRVLWRVMLLRPTIASNFQLIRIAPLLVTRRVTATSPQPHRMPHAGRILATVEFVNQSGLGIEPIAKDSRSRLTVLHCIEHISAGIAIPARVLEGHSALVFAVAFSPDGKRALSGSRDKTVRVWDLEMGAVSFSLKEISYFLSQRLQVGHQVMDFVVGVFFELLNMSVRG